MVIGGGSSGGGPAVATSTVVSLLVVNSLLVGPLAPLVVGQNSMSPFGIAGGAGR